MDIINNLEQFPIKTYLILRAKTNLNQSNNYCLYSLKTKKVLVRTKLLTASIF